MTKQQITILAGLGLAVLCVLCFGVYIVVSEERAYQASQISISSPPKAIQSPTPAPTRPPTWTPTLTPAVIEYYSEEEILQARNQFEIEVLDFNAKDRFGTEFPFSDYVRLRITNNSNMTLPYLTVRTNRFDAQGTLVGWSRAPSIPTSNIKPGESLECDYYPKGHLAGVVNIAIEIEQNVDPDSKEFFPELNQKIPKSVAAAQATIESVDTSIPTPTATQWPTAPASAESTSRKNWSLKQKVDARNEDLSRVYIIRGQRIEIMEPYDDMINKLGPPLKKNTEPDPTYPGSWIAEFIYEEYTCLVCRSGDRYYVWDIYPNE